MKAVVAAFNQEKALVGAFSVITNLWIEFGWNFLKHYWISTVGHFLLSPVSLNDNFINETFPQPYNNSLSMKT